jgi:hypothetical protein
MRGVFFEQRVAPVARSPYRADVALFVGFVDRRRHKHVPGLPSDEVVVDPIVPTATTDGESRLYRWLVSEGWARNRTSAQLDELLDIPVPIDSFELFDRLFAWELRPCGDTACETYLGAAVRSFFVQGGRLCYVVRTGNPLAVPMTTDEATATVAQRSVRLAKLIPGYPAGVVPGPSDDRNSWTGVWTLFGLPDVSFVALPDLPDVVRGPIAADPGLPAPPPPLAVFEECSEPAAAAETSDFVRELRAPLADDSGYEAWGKALRLVTEQVALPRGAGSLREVQVVAAVPRPFDLHAGADLVRYLGELDPSLGKNLDSRGLSSAFLQLSYPWVTTAASAGMAQGIEPPDGTLCGVLARNALERGTYRSIGGRPLIDVTAVEPKLPGRDLGDPSDVTTLGGRVTLLGRDPQGFSVLSDVTTSLDPTFRLAHANRLTSALVRALRVIGESMTFEPSNESTWSSLRNRARDVLREFWRAGALIGSRETDAFTVRCDRTTTTQDDLDAGRVIIEVDVALALSIQRINVVVTRAGGAATLERAA